MISISFFTLCLQAWAADAATVLSATPMPAPPTTPVCYAIARSLRAIKHCSHYRMPPR